MGKLALPLWRGVLSKELLFLVVDSYLVNPACSHMFVSKIKPCMSPCTVKLRMAH